MRNHLCKQIWPKISRGPSRKWHFKMAFHWLKNNSKLTKLGSRLWHLTLTPLQTIIHRLKLWYWAVETLWPRLGRGLSATAVSRSTTRLAWVSRARPSLQMILWRSATPLRFVNHLRQLPSRLKPKLSVLTYFRNICRKIRPCRSEQLRKLAPDRTWKTQIWTWLVATRRQTVWRVSVTASYPKLIVASKPQS